MMDFFDSYVSLRAKECVAQVLDSGVLSEGEWTRKFKRAIEKFRGYNENTIVATNSGASALHLALTTLGIGDEVIVPPLTFVATGLAVLYCGACTLSTRKTPCRHYGRLQKRRMDGNRQPNIPSQKIRRVSNQMGVGNMKKLFFFLLRVVSFQFMVFLLFREKNKLPMKSYDGANG